MRKLRQLFLMVLCAVALSSVAGQKVAVGTGRDYDLRVATWKALREAKLDAVKKAGVYEHIFSHTEIFTSEEKQIFRMYERGVDLLTLEATVSYDPKDLSFKEKIENGECCVTAEIRNAKVWEEKRDRDFTFAIKGFPTICEEGSRLSFRVTPAQDCYIRIFFFDISGVTDSTAMLFPYEASDDIMLGAGQTIVFPPSDPQFVRGTKYVWRARKDDSGKEGEEVAILIAAFKDDVKAPEDKSWNSVVEWIHSIPSDRRTFQVRQVNIAKKQD